MFLMEFKGIKGVIVLEVVDVFRCFFTFFLKAG